MIMSRAIPILLLGLSLGACARASTDYPSLAIRDVERAQGTMLPPAPYIPPPISAATGDQLTRLAQQADAAHREFGTLADRARRAVTAARGQGPGSDNWAVAQVAVAQLESQRSATMIQLADLDRIFVDAAAQGNELTRIEEVRQKVSAMVDSENLLIDELLRSLR
ncbi:hypothetical protein GRI97_11790 [Altererythrobacter xixiisoli]|uniref:DUF4398 domain-containing protein n=1 Tax=Croceibacterium xixiisoli TaxID=1476466 RepID=A0A6I4TX44_9SPHN|nr:hypothetical protein [Croceibacterium xixiisoli]MXO99671.1 hypothetical protein [Croceibacterium xixiisoli]